MRPDLPDAGMGSDRTTSVVVAFDGSGPTQVPRQNELLRPAVVDGFARTRFDPSAAEKERRRRGRRSSARLFDIPGGLGAGQVSAAHALRSLYRGRRSINRASGNLKDGDR